MATVFLAEHPRIGKRVAIKVIHPELSTSQEMVSRFFTEARAVSQIHHENVVEIQDFGQTPDGDNFIIMEFLEGDTLAVRMKEQRIFEVPRAVRIALQMTEALAAAHGRGVIHRDLKPDNIFLLSPEEPGTPVAMTDYDPNRDTIGLFDGPPMSVSAAPCQVKILDFGVSKIHDAEMNQRHQGDLTGHEVLGTPSYLAPEQATGAAHEVDRRADIFALGTILYECLTGQKAFDGPHAVAILRIMMTQSIPRARERLPGLPAAIDEVIARACAMEPRARFDTAKEMCDAVFAAAGLSRPAPLAQGIAGLPELAELGDLPAVAAPRTGPEFREFIDASPGDGPVDDLSGLVELPPDGPGRQAPGPDVASSRPTRTPSQSSPVPVQSPPVPARPTRTPSQSSPVPVQSAPFSAGVPPHSDWGDGDTLFDAEVDALREETRKSYSPVPTLRPLDEFTLADDSRQGLPSLPQHSPSPLPPRPVYSDRATAILDTLATPPTGVSRPQNWAASVEATRDLPRDVVPRPAPVHKNWVVTLTTAAVAVLVGIVVGMLVLKLTVRNDSPSLALERTQQIEQLLSEGEKLAGQGRCPDAVQRASMVLLLDQASARARRLIDQCKPH